MGMKNNNHSKIDELLFLLVENAIDQEGIAYIEKWLSSSSQAKQYYLEFMNDYVAIKNQANAIIDMDEAAFPIHDEYDAELWTALAEAERMAERLPEEKKQSQRPPLIQKVERQKVITMKLNKPTLITFMVSAAALLLMLLFIHISPPPEIKVATLSGQKNAVFAGGIDYPIGSRLSNTTKSMWLQKGMVAIDFDEGAQITIEAPAEFSLNSAKEMILRYGRLYAHVPGYSEGFTVDTPIVRVVDLGTEFGIHVDTDGSNEIHVVKGRVSLITSPQNQRQIGEIVTAGQARCISGQGESIPIPIRSDRFAKNVENSTVLTMNFEGLEPGTFPSGWQLIDNNGSGIGPDYTSLVDSGPSGEGDTCGRVGPADGSLANGPNQTPGGWIQCLRQFSAAAGFRGGFDFRMGATSSLTDAQFLFGDISAKSTDYHFVAISNKHDLQQFFNVTKGIRSEIGKAKTFADTMPDVWYNCRFRFVPSPGQGTTGQFSYEITDSAGEEVFCLMEPVVLTLPDTVTFGFGSFNDTACFDNIEINAVPK